MDEEFLSKDIENEEILLNAEESDYKNLITRLKEIKKTLALLENTIIR